MPGSPKSRALKEAQRSEKPAKAMKSNYDAPKKSKPKKSSKKQK